MFVNHQPKVLPYINLEQKKGSDNNIWIIVENKNGIKRWKLYSLVEAHTPFQDYKIKQDKNTKIKQDENTKIKQDENTKIKLDSVSFYEMYNMPRLTITPKNLETWIKPYDTIKRERFYYFFNVIIPEIQKLGIKIFPIPLDQSYDTGYYYIDTMHKILQDLYNYSYDDFYSNDTLVPVLNINTKNQLADNYIYISHKIIGQIEKKNSKKLLLEWK